MKISAYLRASVLALLAATVVGCASLKQRDTLRHIEDDVAAALASSSLKDYTKSGCLNSLELWSAESNGATLPNDLLGAIFALGDSYIVYSIVYLVGPIDKPSLVLQSTSSTRQIGINASDAAELAALLTSARNDPEPSQPYLGAHTSCRVFFDGANNFVVHTDEAYGSVRSTDRALALLRRLRGAP